MIKQNKNCSLYDDKDTLEDGIIIKAHSNSDVKKYAEKYNISQEDLLKLSIEAVVKNKVPFKVKTTIELD